MRVCKQCGTYLDPEEQCSCHEKMADVLAEQQTEDTAELLKKLPAQVKERFGYMIQGAALVSDKQAG